MPKYISGRSKLRDPSKLTADRYRYVGLDQVEPNLGNPPNGNPEIYGSSNVPSGERYQIVSIEGHPGERYWIPVEGGIIPGSLTIYDEGTLVGGINSTTQLNFVGAAITASSINTFKETTLTLRDSLTFSFTQGLGVTQKNSNAFGYVKESTTNAGVVTITNVTGSFTTNSVDELFQDAVGIARTPLSKNAVVNASVASSITVAPYFSTNEQVTFNDNGEFNGAGGLVYRKNGAGDDTSVGLASVGIGTDDPYRTLHVGGDLKLDGTIYDNDNEPGAQNNILTKGTDGVIWQRQEAVITGAGGTIGQVQYHNDAGTVGGASNFYFDADNDRVGIGSTIPTKLLDVYGESKFAGGDVTFVGVTTEAYWDTSENSFIVKDDAVLAAGNERDLRIYHSSSTSYIVNYTGSVYIKNSSTNTNSDIYIQAKNGENSIVCQDDSSVDLYYNGAKKAETTTNGFKVTGLLEVTSGTSVFSGDVKISGAASSITFDPSDNNSQTFFIRGEGNGNATIENSSDLYISGATVYIQNPGGTTTMAEFIQNGAVKLNHNNITKLQTHDYGIDVTGHTETDTLRVSGITTLGVTTTTNLTAQQLNVSGIGTIDNVQIGHSDDNTINTSTGNLILDSADGTVQVNDVLYLNDSTQSTDATGGALRINGGVGIAKNLNVGGGVTTGGRLKINTHVDINSGFGTFIASVGAATTIDEFNVITSEFKTAEYTLHFEQTDKIHSQKVLVMIGGITTAHSQEFAIMYHPDRMVSFDTTISAGICTLFATPQSGMTGLTTFRFSRSSLL